jgi:hypothetical protein
MLLVGGACLFGPIRIVTSKEQIFRSVGPGIENSVDLPLNISHGQSARVTITFDEIAEMDQKEVWPLIFYMFPTKSVVETVARFINISETSFIIGWENASFLNSFITGFMIQVFYHGSTSVLVNFTIMKQENPSTVTGIGLLIASAIPLWAIVLVHRRRSNSLLTSVTTVT